jgi:hypothetical protein
MEIEKGSDSSQGKKKERKKNQKLPPNLEEKKTRVQVGNVSPMHVSLNFQLDRS